MDQTKLDIATGFFCIEAWMRLEKPLNHLTVLRLLIGRDLRAQLRDLVWSKKLDDFGIKATIISQEELGRKYSNHDIIIIVDESHNFRNSNTNRYQNLQKILSSGKRRHSD